MIKKTTSAFKKEVYEKYKDEYSVLSEYSGSQEKIKVKHNLCGHEYEVTPANFLRGRRCPRCFKTQKKTKDSFQSELNLKFPGSYVVLGEYKNNDSPILVKHLKCGNVFEMRPRHLSQYERCPYCSGNSVLTEEKVNKAIRERGIRLVGELHGAANKSLFLCENGHTWEAYVTNVIRGSGCPICSNRAPISASDLENDLNKTGGEYSVLKFDGLNVTVLHNACGNVYRTTKEVVRQGCGCPKCKSSKGEKAISFALDSLGVKYDRQKRFPDCKKKRELPFDFYVEEFNLCIEYDGEGHFYPFRFNDSNKKFLETKENDRIKTDFCKKNGINLLRISYTDFNNIENIIKREVRKSRAKPT